MFVERNVKKFIGESDVSRTTHQGRYGRWGNRLSCYGDDVTLWLGILARTSHSSQYYHTARLLYAKNIRVAAIYVHCWAYCYTNPLVAVLVEAIALMEQCGPARSLRLQPPYLRQLSRALIWQPPRGCSATSPLLPDHWPSTPTCRATTRACSRFLWPGRKRYRRC
jgi:hypothetical protein